MKKQLPQFIVVMSVLICMFLSETLYAADETWIHEFSVPDNSVVFNDVISVSSGGYLAVGTAVDSNTGDETHKNAFISRFDQNKQVLWSKNFTFPGGSWEDDLRSVVESSDGGFIATGKTLLNGSDGWGNPTFVSAVLILKVDASGNLLWNKLLKNYGNSGAGYGNRIKVTMDGNYVVVGSKLVYHYSGPPNNSYTSGAGGALITKIDTNGEVIFNQVYYGDWTYSYNWIFNDVVQDSEGAYYAVGSASGEAYSQAVGWGGVLVVKMDSSGLVVWSKKLDYAVDEAAVGVNDDGMQILLSNNTLYITSAVNYGFTLTSLTIAGERNWTKHYLPQRAWDAWVGSTADFIPSGDNNFYILTGGAAYTITKVDYQGDVLKSKTLGSNLLPTSLILESDLGLVVGGWYSHYAVGNRAIMSKFDSHWNSCGDGYDISFTASDIEMLTNSVSHHTYVPGSSDDEIPIFSGPTLSSQENCSGIDCSAPGKVTLTSPSGSEEDTTPNFIWDEDTCATWYKFWVGNSNGDKVFAKWYDATENCSDGSCSIFPALDLTNGSYEWYVKSWNEVGNEWSDGMSVTIQSDNTPPSKVIHSSPSGTIQDSTPTCTWAEDPASTYYKFWVGYSTGEKIFAKWYDATEICSNGICSVNFEQTLSIGSYDWYVKSWNDYGKIWSDGMTFTVSSGDDTITD